MKSHLLLLILLLSFGSATSQHQLTLESDEINERIKDPAFFPKVTGQLLNYIPDQEIGLTISYVLVTPAVEYQVEKWADIEDDGTFELELNLGLPYQQMWFSIGEYYYGGLLANEELHVIADLKMLRKDSIQFYGPGISFEGKDAEANRMVNQFYNYKRDEKRALSTARRKVKRDRKLSETEKVAIYKSSFAEQKKLHESFLKEHPSDYGWILENEWASEYYSDLFVIHWGKEMDEALLLESLNHKPAITSNDGFLYYNYLSTVMKATSPKRFQITKALLTSKESSPEAKAELAPFLAEYEKLMAKEDYDKDYFKTAFSKYRQKYEKELYAAKADYYFEHSQTLPPAKADLIKLVGAPEEIWQREIFLEKAIPTLTQKWVASRMQEELKADKAEIKRISDELKAASKTDVSSSLGENVLSLNHETNLYRANHENIETLIQAIRSSYKNKAVIIDVWATWCGPCIADMKSKDSKKIKKELQDLPVEVIYLCVESNSSEELWKNKVVELGVPGDHVFLNSDLKKSLMEYFSLTGYPSYIFIDKEGNYDPDFISKISRIKLKNLKKRL